MTAADNGQLPSAPPPHYAAATSSSSATPSIQADLDTFFDVVPQTDQTSFQVGYLGLDGFRAWIKGDVLIKLDEHARTQFSQGAYTKCQIALYGIESDHDQSITLFSEVQMLWQQSTSEPVSLIPSTLPFSFPLTSDLPHCIHLSNSSLSYRLEATLFTRDSAKCPDAVRSTQVHLTRYTHPGQLRHDGDQTEALKPQTWNVTSPIPMIVQLQRKLFRRAEPIRVLIRIPPPPRKLLSLSLRSVEANLFRIITTKRTEAKHELLLAHSGKLCRLHSTRAIVLRLQLHPPFDISNMPYPHPDHDAAQGGPIYGRGGGGGCESITQDTLLHDVKFLVRISIGIRADDGERKDVTLEHEITILPGAAGNMDLTEDGARSSAKDNRAPSVQKSQKHGLGPCDEESSNAFGSQPGTSSSGAQSMVIDENEEEYDGYEDVGRSLSDTEESSHRSLLDEEDEPPPTLLESRNDLQVEVDVEGVGAGVLRATDGVEDELIIETPPPPIPSEYTWRDDGQTHLSANGDQNALPAAPLLSSPMLGAPLDEAIRQTPFAYQVENGSADEAHTLLDAEYTPTTTAINRADAGSSHTHRPPPYMPPYAIRASNREQQSGNDTGLSGSVTHNIVQADILPIHATGTHSSSSSPIAESAVRVPSIPPSGQTPLLSPPPEDTFPPAYTHPPPSPSSAVSGQYPPRYEA